jgi:hypothetical protein
METLEIDDPLAKLQIEGSNFCWKSPRLAVTTRLNPSSRSEFLFLRVKIHPVGAAKSLNSQVIDPH